MPIQHIHTFLVYPGRSGQDNREVIGISLPLTGQMFDLLRGIYDRSDEECDIDIFFKPNADGQQKNECRDLIIDHLGERSLRSAAKIANRLKSKTDGRSGLGLLFLIVGTTGGNQKIVVSRFPTDSAIFVDEDPQNFAVEFLDKVFMKNKTSYKAVVYKDTSLKGGFWLGRAIDKQVRGNNEQSSDYWISDFLHSDFATSPANGSRRLGMALRNAVSKSRIETKEELISASRLANGIGGETISIDSFVERFGLSNEARVAVVTSLKNPKTAAQKFKLDVAELRNYIAYRSVELDNGALLTAETADFDDVYKKVFLDEDHEIVEYSTRGKIVNDRLKPKR